MQETSLEGSGDLTEGSRAVTGIEWNLAQVSLTLKQMQPLMRPLQFARYVRGACWRIRAVTGAFPSLSEDLELIPATHKKAPRKRAAVA